MARQMFLDLRQARRRIDRHRHRARNQHSEEAREIVETGRQHQRNGLLRFDALGDQPGGNAPRALVQRGIADAFERLALVIQQHMLAPGLPRGVPFEHFDQSLRRIGQRHIGGADAIDRRAVQCALGKVVPEVAQQVARRLRLGQCFGRKARVAGFAQTQHQLHACQAVEPEIALDAAVQRDRDRAAGVRLAHHRVNRGKQRCRGAGVGCSRRTGRFGRSAARVHPGSSSRVSSRCMDSPQARSTKRPSAPSPCQSIQL